MAAERAGGDPQRRRRGHRAPGGAQHGRGARASRATDLTLLATAISEVARNITAYAGEGEVVPARRASARARSGIEVVARDEGPGIVDVELAMQDGYTTGNGLGLGLPGDAPARRRVRPAHRAGGRHDGAPGEVDPCLTGRRGSRRAWRAARSRARSARAIAPCWPPSRRGRSSWRSTGSGTAPRPPTRRRRPRTCSPARAEADLTGLARALPRGAAAARAASS